ncbi:hypothetical protein LSCM4_02613 [Leishmania orientalis]|uniref:Uncharacterized protein n=1 Tax=Leishmania orientalis TaxID=2249476 RepID=A0A836GP80_9TRYP|nr:hypothetical protein LSCM4_02613 [Leishmania orientalis]
MDPLQRRRCGSHHGVTVLCVFLAFLFVLAAAHCTPAHAPHHMSERAEHESVALEKAVKHCAGSSFNDDKHVVKDFVFHDTDAQTGAASGISNTVTSAKSDEGFSSLETVDKPSVKSGPASSASASSAGVTTRSGSSGPVAGSRSSMSEPSSSASASSAGVTTRSGSSGPVAGSRSSMSGPASPAASSDSFAAYSSSDMEAGEPTESKESEATTTLTETTSTVSPTSASPTAKLPADDDGMGTAVVFLILIAFIVALAMYGGRFCPSKCPFFGQNRGGLDHGTRSPMQQQHPLYARLQGSNDGDRGMEPSYAATGAPAGGHKFGRLFQPLSGGGDSDPHHDLFVEMENKPSKTLRGSGVRLGGGATDSLNQVVAKKPAAVNEFLGNSVSSVCPVAVQIPQPSNNSLKSLRKGKLVHTPATTAGVLSSNAVAATASQTTTAPRVESEWKW